MVPQAPNTIDVAFKPFPSLTYKDTGDRIAGFVDRIDAIKQTIYHMLMKERYAYSIYTDNYGTELEQYIGRSFSYLQATIENTLKDSLLQDDRIVGVRVTNVVKVGIDSAEVMFDVQTSIGIIEGMVTSVQL